MSIPHRLRSIFTNVSKNVFCSEASAQDVHIPSAINTGYTATNLKTGHSMPEKPEEHATENIIPNENVVNQLPYTTTVLRVALHCEGCKRKVVEALCKIKGVKKIDISMRKQKVIVCGHIDPSTILKVIKRTGKNVEFWPSDDIQVGMSEVDKENHSKFQQSGLTYLYHTDQEGHHKSEDCPIEPIADMDNETHEVPVVFSKVKLNSYASIDAKYMNPNSEQLPTHISSMTSKFPKSIPQKDVETRRLHSVTNVDDKKPVSVQEKFPPRRSTSYIPDNSDTAYSYLSERPAHHRRHATYEDDRSELVPPRGPADRFIRKLTGSYADSHRYHNSNTFPVGVERRKRTKEAFDDMESDNEPEELFAVMKTKKGLRFVPVDSSPLLRKPTKNLPDDSESELRRQHRVLKIQTPHAATRGISSKQATIPCKYCSDKYCSDIESTYSTPAAYSPQHVSRAPGSLRPHRIARHKPSPSPDYRTADQFPGEDEEEEEEEDGEEKEEDEEEEDMELGRRRELARPRSRSGLHYHPVR
ncbi:hypothetical protein O6H91_10G082500 [Diphasiastrum complanatum]|uniref:Uncharacterized protein n=3 Tax=Diphasiastrum complanatum TaxID=34168 RepID=A0ACC2CIT2_DIPCM|nr:hypothetical protein O6H91_10G082500 [Diphasiastrum complanatum]KAJ7541946.1 hypothetical protein O6H91_10G082500 [Diphasiastrum complanatum]KAJ7541947.1 hypothetical protein O6H91_10G082500 [Diphasiastrum complanatum]